MRKGLVHLTALIGLAASCAYLSWRVGFTLGNELWISIPLWLIELSAVGSLRLFTFSLWDLDRAPIPERVNRTSLRVAVLIPTYNEPREVLLPTVAAATSLEPIHETLVFDDGRRPWVKELAESLGARYLAREVRSHAKAGNLNNAIAKLDVVVVEACGRHVIGEGSSLSMLRVVDGQDAEIARLTTSLFGGGPHDEMTVSTAA